MSGFGSIWQNGAWVDISTAEPPPLPDPPVASILNLNAPIAVTTLGYPQNPIVSYNTASWNAYQIREPGQAIYDPATEQWILTYSALDNSAGSVLLAASLSDDGETWGAGAVISGSTRGEDPYLAKNADGTLYRDGAGKALLYCEEKPGGPDAQRGIDLWHSGVNTLTDWVRYGRVLDRAASGWDSMDRTSPVVIWDGSQLVMLYEGRSTTNLGEVGVAYANADGIAWTPDPNPIIARGGTWFDDAVVPDDVIKIGTDWVLLCHGHGGPGANFLNIGRFITTDNPADWDADSFTELPGNPFTTDTNTAMCHGNDGERLTTIESNRFINLATVYEV